MNIPCNSYFTKFGFGDHSCWSGVESLISVKSWNYFTNLSGCFYGARSLNSLPSTLPNQQGYKYE